MSACSLAAKRWMSGVVAGRASQAAAKLDRVVVTVLQVTFELPACVFDEPGDLALGDVVLPPPWCDDLSVADS